MKHIKIIAALTALCCCIPTVGMNVCGEYDFTPGDINFDGTIDIIDVISVNKAILGKETLSDIQNAAADFNRDGHIDSVDSLDMLKYIVGLYDIEQNPSTVNLSESVKSRDVESIVLDDEFIQAQTDFYLNLFQNAEQKSSEKNILVSPYSVIQCLAMSANGAEGKTKEEMENAFGISMESLNQYLYSQRISQPNHETCRLKTANSIWYRNSEGFSVFPDFLQNNADYYDADAFSSPFDQSTVQDINQWVSSNTDGMIPEIINTISDDQMMYLINAVCFDAQWKETYDDDHVREGVFTSVNGNEQPVEMMMSNKETLYLSETHATGFYKFYSGEQYAFAALLPEEEMTIDEYISGLTAESLHNTLSHPEKIETHVVMPKFSYDYDLSMTDVLREMGIHDAFQASADFSRMSDTPLHISDVLHKTHIDVTQDGTSAAAVTAAPEISGSPLDPYDYQSVTLDRPFVYMIVDMENYLPVFIGAVKSIES